MKLPKSSMKRFHTKRIKTTHDSQKFRLFRVFYPVEQLVKLYNSIFTDNPITNKGFGKLVDAKENFTKYRKEINGENKRFYVKNI